LEGIRVRKRVRGLEKMVLIMKAVTIATIRIMK
jgi:hypothetical protein